MPHQLRLFPIFTGIVLKFSTQYSKEGIALVTREKQALQATSDFPLALANANASWRCGHETAYYIEMRAVVKKTRLTHASSTCLARAIVRGIPSCDRPKF